jgi:hypothetical protein
MISHIIRNCLCDDFISARAEMRDEHFRRQEAFRRQTSSVSTVVDSDRFRWSEVIRFSGSAKLDIA